MTEEEKFFAWLDGELEPAAAAEMEAKVANDPELSRMADEHSALGKQLRGVFDPIAAAPVPDRFQVALRPSAQVVDFAAAKQRRAIGSLPQWAAMAATLAIGIVAGTMISSDGGGPVSVDGGKLYAAASLDQALNAQLASAPAGDVRIGLTFRDQAGQICRSFTQSGASGLACRNGKRWQMRGMFAAPEGQSSDYRMAAGMDPNLAALIGSTASGEPFDAAAEKAAKDRGWR
jgi:hypothetical protein